MSRTLFGGRIPLPYWPLSGNNQAMWMGQNVWQQAVGFRPAYPGGYVGAPIPASLLGSEEQTRVAFTMWLLTLAL